MLYGLVTTGATVVGAAGGWALGQTTLTHDSPVTLAILLGAVGLAFTVGVTLTAIKRDIRELKADNKRLRGAVETLGKHIAALPCHKPGSCPGEALPTWNDDSRT